MYVELWLPFHSASGPSPLEWGSREGETPVRPHGMRIGYGVELFGIAALIGW
jgi:hypothetical protein